MKKLSKQHIDHLYTVTTGLLIVMLVVWSNLAFHTISRAANTSEFSQTINAGTLSVDIVDASGASVGSPSVSFGAATFSFDSATSTGTLGTASEKIRLSNPTATETWSVTIAATSGNTATWSDGGSNTFDFNDDAYSEDSGDTDSVGGRLAVDPTGGTIAGVSGCATTNVSLGSSTAFSEGVTDSITLFSAAAGAATSCRWDLTGVSLSQSLPASQAAATYTLDMTLTAS